MDEAPWARLTPRERDARLAEALGWTSAEEESYWPNREWVWRDAAGMRIEHAGDLASDPVIVRLLEDEIERRGTAVQDDYIRALLAVVAPDGSSVGVFWRVIRATPDQRAQAFVATIKGGA